MQIQTNFLAPILTTLALVFSSFSLTGCGEVSPQAEPAKLEVSFSEFARQLTKNIYNYKTDKYKDYYKTLKPNLTPSVIDLLQGKGFFPNSQKEYENFRKTRKIVKINQIETLGQDKKLLVLVKVTFTESTGDKAENKHTFVYHVGLFKDSTRKIVGNIDIDSKVTDTDDKEE